MTLEKTEIIAGLRSEIKKAFELAEYYLKTIELLGECPSFPVVNELRYAGFHLISATDSNDISEIECSYRNALEHCRRAASDAVEIRIQFYLETFVDFEDSFEPTVIDTTLIPSYIENRRTIRQIRKRVENIRLDGLSDEQYLKTMSNYADTLQGISETWDEAKPNLNKKQQQEKRKWQATVVALLLAAAAIVVSIIQCIF